MSRERTQPKDHEPRIKARVRDRAAELVRGIVVPPTQTR